MCSVIKVLHYKILITLSFTSVSAGCLQAIRLVVLEPISWYQLVSWAPGAHILYQKDNKHLLKNYYVTVSGMWLSCYHSADIHQSIRSQNVKRVWYSHKVKSSAQKVVTVMPSFTGKSIPT